MLKASSPPRASSARCRKNGPLSAIDHQHRKETSRLPELGVTYFPRVAVRSS